MGIGVTKQNRLLVFDSLETAFPSGGTFSSLATYEWDEVSGTPDKGSSPEMIDAPKISLAQARQIPGVQGAADDMSYDVNLDLATNATIFKILDAMQSGESKWFYEEYEAGTDTTLGAGHLYRGKAGSVSLTGQSLNELKAFTFPVSPDSKDAYLVTFSTNVPSFRSLSTGATYTLETLKTHEGITA